MRKKDVMTEGDQMREKERSIKSERAKKIGKWREINKNPLRRKKLYNKRKTVVYKSNFVALWQTEYDFDAFSWVFT